MRQLASGWLSRGHRKGGWEVRVFTRPPALAIHHDDPLSMKTQWSPLWSLISYSLDVRKHPFALIKVRYCHRKENLDEFWWINMCNNYFFGGCFLILNVDIIVSLKILKDLNLRFECWRCGSLTSTPVWARWGWCSYLRILFHLLLCGLYFKSG